VKKLALLFLVTLVAGCGYQVGPTNRPAYKDVKTIFIPVIKNDTYLPQVQTMISSTIIKKFENDGSFRVVNEKEADAYLKIILKRYTQNPLRFSRDNVLVTQEYELVLEADWELTSKTGEKLNSNSAVGRTTFYVGNDLVAARRQAIPLAAEALAYRIVSSVSEGW